MAFSEHAPEVIILKETLDLIDDAVVADDFNEQDIEEVLRNRAYFDRRYNTVRNVAGQSIKSAEYAA